MTSTVSTTPPPTRDEPAQRSFWSNALARPEVGAAVAAIVIFVFFLVVAPPFRNPESLSNVLYLASTLGIVAVGVGLLMIGGEFDLSAGVAVTTAGLTASMISYELRLNLLVGSLVSLALLLFIGFVNGYLVVKTGIPSFLVTLSTFLFLQGANLGITKLVTGQVATANINNMDGYGLLKAIFDTRIQIGSVTVRITVIWWLLFVALGMWILLRTRIGNWIYAVGGNPASARAVGVPVNKVKIGLFMGVSFLAWFYGMHQLYAFNVVQAGGGVGLEFFYIIAAVVGGTLLTGGYGTTVGAAIGAFIFGMTQAGIVYAGWDPNWFRSFLGIMLLLAVMVNLYVKKLANTRK